MQTVLIVFLTLANGWQIFSPSILKNRKEVDTKREEADRVDERIVNLYKNNIEALEKKLKELQTAQEENAKEIVRLTIANSLMTALLQGRDEKTQKFQDEGFVAMKRLMEVEAFLRENIPVLKK